MNPMPCRLEGDLTIAAAGGHAEVLRAALAEARGDLCLDLAGVVACDSAGLQLLLAAQRSLARQGGVLQLQAPPPVVLEAMTTLGLQDQWPLRPALRTEPTDDR